MVLPVSVLFGGYYYEMAEKMIEPPESGVQFVTITNVHFTDRHRKLNRT